MVKVWNDPRNDPKTTPETTPETGIYIYHPEHKVIGEQEVLLVATHSGNLAAVWRQCGNSLAAVQWQPTGSEHLHQQGSMI